MGTGDALGHPEPRGTPVTRLMTNERRDLRVPWFDELVAGITRHGHEATGATDR